MAIKQSKTNRMLRPTHNREEPTTMATIFGRRNKSQPDATTEQPAQTIEEITSEQTAVDTLRERLAELRPRVKDLEADQQAIEAEVSDILLTNLMGTAIDSVQLNDLYQRREANRQEIEQTQAMLDRAESQLTAMVDQENARLAAMARVKLEGISTELQAMEAEYVRKIAEFGDFFDSMLAKRGAFQQADKEFYRHSPNHGPGVQPPRQVLFTFPERYMQGSTYGLASLREQIEAWQREPEEKAEANRREHEHYARVSEHQQEQERIAQERAERYAANQQHSSMRYP
jgi:hypothetical protein